MQHPQVFRYSWMTTLPLSTLWPEQRNIEIFFSARAVGTWDSLPIDVVLSNNSNQFKNKIYDNLGIKKKKKKSRHLNDLCSLLPSSVYYYSQIHPN